MDTATARPASAWRDRALSLQLTGMLVLLTVLPLLTYHLVASRSAEQTILELASQQSQQSLRSQRDYLSLQVDQVESLATNLSQMEEIPQALGQTGSPEWSMYESLSTKARIGYVLSNYRNLAGGVSIDLFGLDGTRYHVGETLVEAPLRKELLETLLDVTFRSKALVTWHGVQDSMDLNPGAGKVISASKRLVRPNSSWLREEPVGLLLINYATDALHERLSAVDLGQGAYLMVVDQHRRLIYHPDRNRIGDAVTPEFAALLRGTSASFIQRLGDTDVLLGYEALPDKDWYVVGVIPEQTLLAPLAHARRTALAMLAAMLLAIVLLLRLVATRVVTPIANIAENFRKFRLNRIPAGWRMAMPRSLKSIDDLVRWFNAFLEHMEARRDAETHLRIAATAFEAQEGICVLDARLRVLRANGALLALCGYAHDELVGRHARQFVADPRGTPALGLLRQQVRQTGAWQGEVWCRSRSGRAIPTWISFAAVRDDENRITHYVATLTDISERKASEEEIQKLAFFDPLTALPNRRLLNDRLQQAMRECPRRGQAMALMMVDLDRFKMLNDTLGHDVGDALLRHVSERLVRCVREADTVARLGGDEFVVIAQGLGSRLDEAARQAALIATKIQRSLSDPCAELAGTGCHCSVSIGTTVYLDATCSADELMKQADIALYRAKEAGRNSVCAFAPPMLTQLVSRAALEQDLRDALEAGQLLIHLQPKLDSARRVTGAEALVRWQHPRLGLLGPRAFIELAEESGLIQPMGMVVLRKACEQLVAWDERPERRHLKIAVNVSARQFRQTGFVRDVMAVLDLTGANPARLALEITESLLVDDFGSIVDKMNALRQLGIGFSLDDFGTGYSSLSYLKRLPLQELKIDSSFVRDVLLDTNDATIVRAVVAMGHELGLEVVAEGVETQPQLDFLMACGCRFYQGFFFARPMPENEFERYLATPQPQDALA